MTATASDPLAPIRTPARPGPGPLSAASLRALELAVGRRVNALLAGDYRSAFAGVGTELWQLMPTRQIFEAPPSTAWSYAMVLAEYV